MEMKVILLLIVFGTIYCDDELVLKPECHMGVLYDNKCHVYMWAQPQRYRDAASACKELRYGYLTGFADELTWQNLTALMAKDPKQFPFSGTLWIGLDNLKYGEDNFMWGNEDPYSRSMSMTLFGNEDLPKAAWNEKKCIRMNTRDKTKMILEMGDCERRDFFLCTIPPTYYNFTCDSEYIKFLDTCVKFFLKMGSYGEDQAQCLNSSKGLLVKFNSWAIAQFLRTEYLGNSNLENAGPFFVGMSDDLIETHWKHEDGTEVSLNTANKFFVPAEPRSNRNKNCAIWTKTGTPGLTLLKEVDCNEKYAFICQYYWSEPIKG